MGKHRAEVRPRYGRIAVLGSSLAITGIAVLGGTGVLPSSAVDEPRTGQSQQSSQPQLHGAADLVEEPTSARSRVAGPQTSDQAGSLLTDQMGNQVGGATPAETESSRDPSDTALPDDSGEGKRVVFSEERQRVWLVDESDEIDQTYLVSGSIYDNLEPGTFEVYSRSEDAVGIDDSGTMKYFVRFTQGDTGAAIGFHDIPVLDGDRIQRFDELGTPLSHGCIRQRRSDAIALWEFAPLGTTVVVTI